MPELCCVVAPQNMDGILDRIAHEVAKSYACTPKDSSTIICYDHSNVPPAERYFVTHWRLLPSVLQKVNPGTHPVTCFFTHVGKGLEETVPALNLCHSIIAESHEGVRILEELGVNPALIHFVPEGGDSEAFKPHQRSGNGKVLICSNYYPRKSPTLLLDVIKESPRQFILLGNGWEKWSGYSELSLQKNFIRSQLPYSGYPVIFGMCDVFLSVSELEGGGPNALIEAMHANLFPVVSDTGNAREYIIHRNNGLIFPQGSSAKHIAALIEDAYLRKPQLLPPYNDVYETVADFTWANFAHQVKEVMEGVYSTEKATPFD